MAEPLTPETATPLTDDEINRWEANARSNMAIPRLQEVEHGTLRLIATIRALEAERDDFELALRHAIADKAIDGGASLDNVDPGTGIGIYLSKLAALESENARLRRIVLDTGNLRQCEPCLTRGGSSGDCLGCRARRALGDPDHG